MGEPRVRPMSNARPSLTPLAGGRDAPGGPRCLSDGSGRAKVRPASHFRALMGHARIRGTESTPPAQRGIFVRVDRGGGPEDSQRFWGVTLNPRPTGVERLLTWCGMSETTRSSDYQDAITAVAEDAGVGRGAAVRFAGCGLSAARRPDPRLPRRLTATDHCDGVQASLDRHGFHFPIPSVAGMKAASSSPDLLQPVLRRDCCQRRAAAPDQDLADGRLAIRRRWQHRPAGGLLGLIGRGRGG
jgi:hypothetical protein